MNKGFTLVELLGIISVLAIFMAVAMPSLIENNKKKIEQQKKSGTTGFIEFSRPL